MKEKAKQLTGEFTDYFAARTAYLLDQRPSVAYYAGAEIANGLQMMLQAIRVCFDNGEMALAEEINGRYNELYARYAAFNQ